MQEASKAGNPLKLGAFTVIALPCRDGLLGDPESGRDLLLGHTRMQSVARFANAFTYRHINRIKDRFRYAMKRCLTFT